MGYALRDQHQYSYGDYRTWPENQRYELVEGSAFMIESASSLDHQTIAFEVGCQLGNALENHPCRVFLAPVDVLLPLAGEADDAVTTVVQPDVLVVCDPAKLRSCLAKENQVKSSPYRFASRRIFHELSERPHRQRVGTD